MGNIIADGYVRIIPTADGMQNELEKALGGEAESAGKSIGGKFGSAMGTAAKVGIAGVVAATGAVTAFGKASVDAGKTFDSSMSQVAATMGYLATEEGFVNSKGEDVTKTFNELSNFAQEMGSKTSFSASEAAEALNYMALAGYDSKTSMEMLPSVLDLAAAGGIGLAEASDMVTDTQSALGLSLDETKTMIDQMAVASSKTNTSVAQLGNAMLTVGGTAKTMKGGTAEISQVLGLLADNGIKASEGGTHLRNILLSLGSASKDLKENFDIDVYDENGQLNELSETFTKLNEATKSMTDEERQNLITGMFNKTDLSAVNALLDTTAQRWTEVEGALQNTDNAAKNMATTQLDNLEGDVTLFKSALEGVQIQVSSMLTPTIRDFVSSASNGLGEIAGALQKGDIEGAFANLGDYLGSLLNNISDKLPEVVKAAESLLSAFGQALMDNLPQLTQTALDIISSIVEYLIQATPSLLEAAIEIISTLAKGLGEQLPTLIPQAIEMILTLVEGLYDNIDMLIDAAIQLQMGLADGLIQAIPIIIEKAPTIIEKLVTALITNAPRLIMVGPQIIIKLAMGIMQAVPMLIMKIPQIISQMIHGFLNAIPEFIKVGKEVVTGIWTGIKNSWGTLVENVKASAKNLVQALVNTFKIGSPSKVMRDEIGKWIPEGIAVGINDTSDSPIKALNQMSDGMTNSLQNQITSDITMNPITSGASVEVANNDTAGLYDLMSKYLPQMANSSVNISLEGDAAGLFNAVRKQDTLFSKANGRSAFA